MFWSHLVPDMLPWLLYMGMQECLFFMASQILKDKTCQIFTVSYLICQGLNSLIQNFWIQNLEWIWNSQIQDGRPTISGKSYIFAASTCFFYSAQIQIILEFLHTNEHTVWYALISMLTGAQQALVFHLVMRQSMLAPKSKVSGNIF